MKKLYIACPTVGRDYKEVIKDHKKLHKLAEVIFEESFMIVGTLRLTEFKERTVEDYERHMRYLKEADYVVTVGAWCSNDRLASIVHSVCAQCGIPQVDIPEDFVTRGCVNMKEDFKKCL